MKGDPPRQGPAHEETVEEPSTRPDWHPAPADLERTVDGSRYRLGPLVGEGGRGQVYRAYDCRLMRDVALKFLSSRDPAQVGPLLREARAQARVDHPHVCKVYEVDDLGERPFICMQLVIGQTLSAAARGREMRVKVGLLVDVAGAVEAAHRLGIIHRDLKPGNILVEESATGGLHPYVMDFGLARDVGTTLSHAVVGTPAYMAPEQARGDSAAIGPRTDVYGLGATLYEVLTGEPPIDGATVMEVLGNVASVDPIPLRRRDPRLPRDLEVIVGTCLDKDPARRYASAQALADDLTRFLEHEPIEARPPSIAYKVAKRLRRHAGLSLLAVASLVGLALVLTLAGRPRWKPRTVALGPGYEEWAGPVSLAPDGKELVYASRREGRWRIYAEALAGEATGPPRALTPPEMGSAYDPHVSRDGAAILFTIESGRDLFQIGRLPRAGGEIELIDEEAIQVEDCGGGRLIYRYLHSPDCYECDRLVLQEADGRQRQLVEASRIERLESPRCDPAGRRFVYRHGRVTEDKQQIELVDLESGQSRALGPPLVEPQGMTFHPDGRSVLFAQAGRIWEVSPGGDPTPVTDGIDDAWPVVSADGRLLIYNQVRPDAPIYAQPQGGGAARRLSPVMGVSNDLKVSPDGEEVIMVSTRERREIIVAVSVKDGSERTLAEGIRAAVSLDGRQVFFVRPTRAESELFSVPRQGGEVRPIAKLPGQVFAMVHAADGLHAGLIDRGGNESAWRVPLDGSPPVREAGPPVRQIVPSPDGRWTLVRKNPGMSVVLPAGADLADARAIRASIWAELRWAPDSSLLGRDESVIKRLEPESRAISEVAEIPAAFDPPRSWAVSPDRRTLYVAAGSNHVRRVLVTNFAERPRP